MMNVEQWQAAADPQVVQKRKLGEMVSDISASSEIISGIFLPKKY